VSIAVGGFECNQGWGEGGVLLGIQIREKGWEVEVPYFYPYPCCG